jgi:hypothetical protein
LEIGASRGRIVVRLQSKMQFETISFDDGELISDQRGGETKSSVVLNGAFNTRARHARGNPKKMTLHDLETLHVCLWHKTSILGSFGVAAIKGQ